MSGFEIKVTKGIEPKPVGIVVFSDSGLGKTTFLAEAAKAAKNGILFQCVENGLGDLKKSWVDTIPIYNEILGTQRVSGGDELDNLAEGWRFFKEDVLKYLMVGEHSFDRVCFDSFSELVNKNLVGYVVKTYYNKDLKEANNYSSMFAEMYSELSTIIKGFEYLQNKKKMEIFISCHATTTKFRDPAAPDYNKWVISIPGTDKYSISKLLINWSTMTCFGHRDVEVKRGKAGSEYINTLKTKGGASWEGKSRKGIPESIKFDYSVFEKFLNESEKESVGN